MHQPPAFHTCSIDKLSSGQPADRPCQHIVSIFNGMQQLQDISACLGNQSVCEVVKGCSERSCHLLYFKTVMHSLVYATKQD